jgi:hypothetical protein
MRTILERPLDFVLHSRRRKEGGREKKREEGRKEGSVQSKMVLSEDLGPCISTWKNPSRMCGCKWGLLNVRKGNTKGAWWGAGGV